MEEHRYRDISVEDICDRAGVGRSTFYTHYKGKDDLKRDGLRTVEPLFASGGNGEPALSFSLPMFRHAENYIAHYRDMAGTPAGDAVLSNIRQMVVGHLRRALGRSTVLDQKIEFVAGAFMSVLTWWLDGGVPVSAEEMDARFQRLSRGTLDR